MDATRRKRIEATINAIHTLVAWEELPDGALPGTGLTLEASLIAVEEALDDILASNRETMKAGTRCECRSVECPTKVGMPDDGKTHGERILGGGCIRDAVCLVKVIGGTMKPMCTDCADWHEKEGAK